MFVCKMCGVNGINVRNKESGRVLVDEVKGFAYTNHIPLPFMYYDIFNDFVERLLLQSMNKCVERGREIAITQNRVGYQ